MRKLVLFFIALVVVVLLLVLKTKSASAFCQCAQWTPHTEPCCTVDIINGELVNICGLCSQYKCSTQNCTGLLCGPGYYTCNRGCCEIGAQQHTGGAKPAKCPDGATPTMKSYLGCVQSKYCSAGRYYYGTCFRNAKDMDDGEPSGIKCYAGYTCPSSCNATAPSNVVVKQRLPKS